jgi:hypothetical protein
MSASPSTHLIAEDLLLLLLDDRKGTNSSAYTRTALGGAVLVELALAEAVTVEEKTRAWRSAKVYAGAAPAGLDPVLERARATIAERQRSAQDLVDRLGKGLDDELAERLAQKGMLERRDGRILGLFPVTRWPVLDSAHEEAVRGSLTAALVEGAEPDARTAALVALLHAIGRAHKTVPHEGLPSSEVRKRAKRIAEGDWAAKAVKDAIEASTAAIAAVAAGAAVASSSG